MESCFWYLIQNAVLKALRFMFEYIGEMSKDYVYALTPILEHALTDRDLVHRQTAAWAVKHLSLGVSGQNCEATIQHPMNYVWPNIFETALHTIQAFFDALEGFRVALGAGKVLPYILPGKLGRFTGACTTISTLEARTQWYPRSP